MILGLAGKNQLIEHKKVPELLKKNSKNDIKFAERARVRPAQSN